VNLLAAELLKLRTTRTIYALLGALLVIVAIATLVFTLDTAKEQLAADDDGLFGSPLTGIIFVLLVGVMLLAGEYRHGTITQTLLITPERWKVLAAKLVAGAILGVAFAVISELVATALGAPLMIARGVDFEITGGAIRLIVGTIGAMALAGALGVALAAVIRNQVVAIIVVFAWLLIIEPTLAFALEDTAPYLPGAAMAAVVGVEDQEILSWQAGTLMLLIYVAGLSALGERFVLSRDVNAIQP
jgi:ABC-2 type transport system permease protein